MPIVEISTYRAPHLLTNGHLQTVYPKLFRRVGSGCPVRERLELDDGDFLDVDWHRAGGSRKVAVLSHGLEGNSASIYMRGMARCLNYHGWDVLCWNFRGCSEEMNRLARFYHSGDTDDLHTVLSHALAARAYDHAALVGFSMGGNQILKYLGESPKRIPPELVGAATFSVPCQLADAAFEIGRWFNRIYLMYFMWSLHKKVRMKAKRFPKQYSTEGLSGTMRFETFDHRFTAPLHSFASAQDYYEQSSSARYLDTITVPTLIVQAVDDPFLPDSCYPRTQAMASKHLVLEIPAHGGHVGFIEANTPPFYWSETRTVQFLENLC
jgi:predicted alpha/beta-fold hydrolase